YASQLSEDLRRFQTGQLINARKYSTATLALRWFRRHQFPLSVTAAFLIALALVSGWSVRRIIREKDRAEARKNELTLLQAKTYLEQDPTAAVALLKTYPDSGANWELVRQIALDAESRGVATHVIRSSPGTKNLKVRFSSRGVLAAAGRLAGLQLWDVSR